MKNIQRIKVLFMGVLFFFATDLEAQLDYISIQNITHKDGLSNNYVKCIEQDNMGFIWIGTNDGLNRYDGYAMKTYYNDLSDSTSISDNKITALEVDGDGILWIGTETNGLCRYNPFDDNFVRYKSAVYNENVLSHSYITDIISDVEGRLWVSTYEGINLYNKQNDKFEQINFGLKYLIEDDCINRLKKCNISNSALNAANKLLYKSYNTKQEFKKAIHKHASKKLTDNEICVIFKHSKKWIPDSLRNYNRFRSIAADPDGYLWLLYEDMGFAQFNPDLKTLVKHSIFPKVSPSKEANKIRSVVVNSDHLWLGTFNDGVYIFSKHNSKIKKVFKKNMQGALAMQRFESNVMFFSEQLLHLYPESAAYYPEKAFPKTKRIPEITFNVTYMLKDRSNNFWIASEGEGVFIMHQNKKFNLFNNTKSSKIVLSKREVTSLAADRLGNVFIGYYRNNIDKINLQNNTIETLRSDAFYPNNTAPGSVLELTVDKHNDVWVGSYYAGLQKLNANSGLFRFLGSNGVYDFRGIAFDSQNNIWAIAHGKGLFKFDPKGNFLKNWQANYEDWQNNLSSNWPNDICIDRFDNVYIASNQGISVTNINGDKFKSYRNTTNDDKSLSHNTCIQLYLTSNNKLWIGTANGLNFFDPQTEEFRQITKANGLANGNINSVIDDHRGNLWVATNSGLSRLIIDYNNGVTIHSIENYDVHDGVLGELYHKAVTKTADGNLFFGGKNGLSWFHPDSIKLNTHLLNVVVSDIKIFNESIFDKSAGYPELRQSFLKQGEITLNNFQNSLSLEFTALSYIQKPKNKYSCMLKGFDTDWQDIGNTHKVNYTNLEPGNYTFMVKAYNNDGICSEEPTMLEIKILPPFWKSTIGYLIIIGSILIFLTIIYFNFRSRLILINRIKMRKMEAENLRQIDRGKSSFFTNITHELRTPITLIQGPIRKILNTDSSQLNVDEIKLQLSLVNRNTDLLLRLVNQVLDFKKADAGKLSFKQTYENAVPFILNIAETFNSLASEKSIYFKINCSVQEIFMLFAPEKLEKIIYNLLSNAFKYTLKGGIVELNISVNSEHQDELKIVVKDTGIGISSKNHDKIFNMYYQADNAHDASSSGTGIGLYMVKTYTELHNGKVWFASEIEKGSVFTITIPIKKGKQKQLSTIQPEIITDTKSTLPVPNEKRMNILIVEDNVDIRFFLKNELEEVFSITSAGNGFDALEIIKEKPPHIILSDIMMPGMDGYELCEIVKSNVATCHIPVVLLTAKISNESNLKGYEAGADDYITKPFDPEILIVKISRILENRKLVQSEVVESTGDIPLQLKETNNAEKDFLKELFKVLEQNLDNSSLDVEYLARELLVSRSLLYEKVNVLTGQTVADYIKNYRLNRAAEMLKSGENIVSEVVWKVGFKSHAHFTRAFKQKYNCAPSKFAAELVD